MQLDGNLVLSHHLSGRACWASNTRAPGDASATFHNSVFTRPYVTIDSSSQGRIATIYGGHGIRYYGDNASDNARGEFWIGYDKIGSC